MGFFSDLKEDLSQAVNEMLPEDADEVMPKTEENAAEPSVDDTVDDFDLSAMLDKVAQESEPVKEPEVEKVPEKPVQKAPERKSEGFAKRMDALKAADENAIITAGMKITGDINSDGSMDLLGTVIGNINVSGKLNVTGAVQGNSKAYEIFADNARINGEVISEGSVKIGQSSIIIGNISAMSAVIAGAVKGDIDVHGPVILDASAIVMGNIKSKSVQINNGAVIEGMCSQCYADVNPTSFFDDLKKAGK